MDFLKSGTIRKRAGTDHGLNRFGKYDIYKVLAARECFDAEI